MYTRKQVDARAIAEAGISLIELVLFIAVVSVGIAGILTAMNVVTRRSADPMIQKQALAIAEAVLEEVMLMPFTFCDPNDPVAETAAAGGCTTGMDQSNGGGSFTGPIPGTETRYNASNPFDNVADYAGFSMTGGIFDITSGGTTPIAGLGNYRLQPITIARIDNLPNVPTDAAVLITVTVTDPSGQNIVLQGVRTRYAPNTLP